MLNITSYRFHFKFCVLSWQVFFERTSVKILYLQLNSPVSIDSVLTKSAILQRASESLSKIATTSWPVGAAIAAVTSSSASSRDCLSASAKPSGRVNSDISNSPWNEQRLRKVLLSTQINKKSSNENCRDWKVMQPKEARKNLLFLLAREYL